MKKIFFSTVSVLTIGATVVGGNAYNVNNDDMSELFLGGVEQIALAENPADGREWDDVDEGCTYVVAYPTYNKTVEGVKCTCKSGSVWTSDECAPLQHPCE